jgi:hypothetical protein
MADLTTLRDLCVQMQSYQEMKDTLDEKSKELGVLIDGLRLKQIPEMMDQLECQNATFPGIGRVQVTADLYCSTRAGMKDEAILWLRDQGLDGMITTGFNASSMKALIRRLIVDGVEPPPCLNVQPFVRASITRV